MLAHSEGVNAIDLRKGFLFQWMTRGVKDTESTYSSCQSPHSLLALWSLLGIVSEFSLQIYTWFSNISFAKHITEENDCSQYYWFPWRDICTQLMQIGIVIPVVSSLNQWRWRWVVPSGTTMRMHKNSRVDHVCPDSGTKYTIIYIQI